MIESNKLRYILGTFYERIGYYAAPDADSLSMDLYYIALCGPFIRHKSPTNSHEHLKESNLQTHWKAEVTDENNVDYRPEGTEKTTCPPDHTYCHMGIQSDDDT